MGHGIITRRGLNTSDATATAAKILAGFTAYVNGVKLTGTSAAVEIATGVKTVSSSTKTIVISDLAGKTNFIIALEGQSGYTSTGGTGFVTMCARIDGSLYFWYAGSSGGILKNTNITFDSSSGYIQITDTNSYYWASTANHAQYRYIGW